MPKNDHKCSKNGHFWNLNFQVFFFQNWKTQFSNQIVIYVIAFDQINIQICLAPQNDRQILSFLKYSYVLGQKMTRNGRKLAKRKSCQFFKSPVFSWNSFKQIIWRNPLPIWILKIGSFCAWSSKSIMVNFGWS